MNSYGDALKELGFDMKSAESSSSSLAKGIEGVTEDTANLLGSYINGIRADVSVQRKLQEQLVNELMPKSNYIAEAQLTQLSQIQRNTAMNVTVLTEFRDLFRRATTPGSGVRVNV